MKLRSHEILSEPNVKVHSTSRFKQLFQRKNLVKKKPAPSPLPTASHLRHAIPHYVRKSILRFLLESPSSSSSPSPSVVIQQQSPSRNVRPPVMGIQALKTKKQQQSHSNKRPLRTRVQPTIDEVSKPKTVDEFPQTNNYDMTILHMDLEDDDNEQDSSIFATKSSTQHKKPIPQWARKNELQIAICNQLYFHRNPSEIFGNSSDCSPAHLRTILHSMLPNVQLIDDDRPITSSSSLSINNHQSILV